jgi:hypothetical protein
MTHHSPDPQGQASSPSAESTDSLDTNVPDQMLSEEQLAKQQDEYRQAYLEQLRRRSCPGCGDDGSLPY